MGNQYPHIRWRRNPEIVPRPRGLPHVVPLQVPLREDRASHGSTLLIQTQQAVAQQAAFREAAGIDPSRLMLLQLTLLGESERQHLEKLGIRIVHEEELRANVQSPDYAVLIKFIDKDAAEAFEARSDLQSLEIRKVESVRSVRGGADPLQRNVCFPELEPAKQFVDASKGQCGLTWIGKPVKRSSTVKHRLIVQFPDRSSLDRFQQQQQAYRTGVSATLLTARQRGDLLDALEEVSRLRPEDRMGHQLLTQGPPSDLLFYLDVDLWHPGNPTLTAQLILDFKTLLTASDGKITDHPSSVAETLLLSRIRGSKQTLATLANYDWVARVDLPPSLEPMQSGLFDCVLPTEPHHSLSDEAPLACAVDSGVVKGHPMLRGLVVDEQDFDSGEGSVIDNVGHGMHVAGVIVYGNTHACLKDNGWVPRVRLLSAKVMKRSPQGRAEFADEKRVETQIRDAITTFYTKHRCRIFNLSFGHPDRAYSGGLQLPWGMVLDELATRLDILIVASAGNFSPSVPQVYTSEDFRGAVRDQLYAAGHRIIDPGYAANIVTVGSIAFGDRPFRARQDRGQRPALVGAPATCPSPFTRTGVIEAVGAGPCRMIKPDVVAFGGNYSLGLTGRVWYDIDPDLGVPSLRRDYHQRLLSVACGTSFATPYVTHVGAIVEAELKRQGSLPSANLIRALVVHSARVSPEAESWLAEGCASREAQLRRFRAVGYGMPDPHRASSSSDNYVVLMAEDEIEEERFHLYEIDIPEEFLNGDVWRYVRVTLAYDPPVRATRKEYIGRSMLFHVYGGVEPETVRRALLRAPVSGEPPANLRRYQLDTEPSCTFLQWSTVQSAVFKGKKPRKFDRRTAAANRLTWVVTVGCKMHFSTSNSNVQRYALVMSLEHPDESVELYQAVRNQIVQRIRVTLPNE